MEPSAAPLQLDEPMTPGSFHTMDRLAREIADDDAPPAEEALRALEADFARREDQWLRSRQALNDRIRHLAERNEWYKAALRALRADLAASRQEARAQK